MKLKTYNEIKKQHLENIKGGASMTTSVYMIYQQGRLESAVKTIPVCERNPDTCGLCSDGVCSIHLHKCSEITNSE